MNFRKLKAEEVDVRIGTISDKNVTLLLYKDARVDMQILDETVGAENWQREHYECKGNLFCRVGIKTPDTDWVWKSDCGTESNTEKEKGEASDSFKRACVNWGIGRELYTAPRIMVDNATAGVTKEKKCWSKFKCSEIGYDENGVINRLTIDMYDFNGKFKDTVFSMGDTAAMRNITNAPAPKATKTERSNEPPRAYR